MAARKTAARKTTKARTTPATSRKKAAPAPKPATRSAPRDVDTTHIHAHRAGSPPVGTIGEDAIERLITQWVRRPKQPADYAFLPRGALLREARELLAAREDLPVFAAAHTPINARAFDYLEVLIRFAEEEVGTNEPPRPKAIPSTAAAQEALEGAVESLRTVLARAEACGRPLRMFELSQAPWSPRGFITQLLHVVQAGRRRVEKWDDPEYALTLFTRLEQDALELEAAWKLPRTEETDDEDELRRLALCRLLYDATTYVAAYGRAVFAADDPRRARYLLGQVFPPQVDPPVPAPRKLLDNGT